MTVASSGWAGAAAWPRAARPTIAIRQRPRGPRTMEGNDERSRPRIHRDSGSAETLGPSAPAWPSGDRAPTGLASSRPRPVETTGQLSLYVPWTAWGVLSLPAELGRRSARRERQGQGDRAVYSEEDRRRGDPGQRLVVSESLTPAPSPTGNRMADWLTSHRLLYEGASEVADARWWRRSGLKRLLRGAIEYRPRASDRAC